jgi:hypothetical protein
MQTMAVSPTERRYIRREHPPTLNITPRVLAILDALHRYSVLTSEQIARLDGGSHQKVLRILQLAFDHGLVDRPGARQYTSLSPFFDHRPCVYALSRKGARVLAGAGVDIDASVDRTTRNKRAVLIEHGIEVAETMFAFEAACAAHGAVRLVDQHSLLANMPPEARDLRKPLRVKTTVRPTDFPHLRLLKNAADIGVEPDRVFAFMLPDNTGWSFGLELDRATERVVPKHLSGTSILRKQLAIYHAWRTGELHKRWGPSFKAFRCLFVTKSEARVHHMLESQEMVTRGAASNLFHYTTAARLATQGPLQPIWMTTKKDGVSLLERE